MAKTHVFGLVHFLSIGRLEIDRFSRLQFSLRSLSAPFFSSFLLHFFDLSSRPTQMVCRFFRRKPFVFRIELQLKSCLVENRVIGVFFSEQVAPGFVFVFFPFSLTVVLLLLIDSLVMMLRSSMTSFLLRRSKWLQGIGHPYFDVISRVKQLVRDCGQIKSASNSSRAIERKLHAMSHYYLPEALLPLPSTHPTTKTLFIKDRCLSPMLWRHYLRDNDVTIVVWLKLTFKRWARDVHVSSNHG